MIGYSNSTLAGGLAASKLHIPVDHVEAGLRSFNKKMPEEINRILCDHVASLLFTPTATASKNLVNEGISADKIKEVGDIMYDTILLYQPVAQRKHSDILQRHDVQAKQYILATLHRAENTDELARLEAIIKALDGLAKDIPVILPIHPRTKSKIASYGIETKYIRFIDPVGYLEMLMLTSQAQLILTDSGGLQKEAYFLGVPCGILRDQTEWVELLGVGYNALIKVEVELLTTLQHYIDRVGKAAAITNVTDIYGNGTTATHISRMIGEAH